MSTTSNDTALLTRDELLVWLHEDDPQKLETLWSWADDVRRSCVGDQVHLRGLIEFGNVCRRECLYCGIRKSRSLPRYRMLDAEILACAERAAELGFGTVVLQSGEDAQRMDPDAADGLSGFATLIRTIKERLGLAVTLSIGEHTDEVYRTLREAGADRFLLRFETSDPVLYHKIHPPIQGETRDRFAVLRALRELGYEVGSGVMVGIPGQSREILADDLLRFVELGLDMVGVGPFVPSPATPLGKHPEHFALPAGEQVPADETMAYKVLALTRLLRPYGNHPSTTALATVDRANGRRSGLQRGANVVMPNITPARYRAAYEIYPAKACLSTDDEAVLRGLHEQIRALGREPGFGRGDSKSILARRSSAAADAQQETTR